MKRIVVFALVLNAALLGVINAQPANDWCFDAIELPFEEDVDAAGNVVLTTYVEGEISDATPDVCADSGGCNTETQGVWFSFYARGLTTFSLCNDRTNFGCKISTFRGDCSNLDCWHNQLDSNECTTPSPGRQLQAPLFSSDISRRHPLGIRLLVYVATRSSNARVEGRFGLSIITQPPPLREDAEPNDLCPNALNFDFGPEDFGFNNGQVRFPNAPDLVFEEGVDGNGQAIFMAAASGNTVGSNPSLLIPENSECGSTSPDIWYSVTGNGWPMRADTCGSDFDTRLSIFEGDCSNLSCVTTNDDACGLQSSVLWNTQLGATYLVLVHGFQDSEGNFTLNVSTQQPQQPQNFLRGDANTDGAFDISDVSYLLNFLFLGSGDPFCSDAADVNDDGALDLSDPITVLNRLFLGGLEIASPGAFGCGVDPTEDSFDCERFPPCDE